MPTNDLGDRVDVEHWLEQVAEAAVARGADPDSIVVASPDKARGLTLAQCQRHLYKRQFGPQRTPPGQRLVPVSFIEEYIQLLEASSMNALMRFVRVDVARQIIDGGVDPDPDTSKENRR